jgi:DNA-binding transcriptional LysR family regulator
MDLRQLEYIITIAEEKNISRAADRLFVSQPALSQYLQKLEQDLGVSLFNRIKNSLTLTYAGRTYVEAAKELFIIKKKTYNIIEDIIDSKKGHLVLGISLERGTAILPYVLPEFNVKYPGISIELIEESTKNLVSLTLQGNIDLSLMPYYDYETQLDYEILCNEEIVLAVPKSHKLAYLADNVEPGKRPVADLSLFKDDNFVLMKKDRKTRQISDNIFKDSGFIPHVLFESSSIYTVQTTAVNCSALSMIPEKMINYSTLGDKLVYFSINPGKYYWPIVAAYRKGSYPTRATKELISMLRSYLNSTPS